MGDKGKLPEIVIVGNLFLPLPDTDFRDYLDEIEDLAKSAPEIVVAIEKDLDVHARQKKKIRLEDQKYFASRTAALPNGYKGAEPFGRGIESCGWSAADAGLCSLCVSDGARVYPFVDLAARAPVFTILTSAAARNESAAAQIANSGIDIL